MNILLSVLYLIVPSYLSIEEVRQPLPPEPDQPERYDYEYKRNGSVNLFADFQPLVGWRHIEVTKQRTLV